MREATIRRLNRTREKITNLLDKLEPHIKPELHSQLKSYYTVIAELSKKGRIRQYNYFKYSKSTLHLIENLCVELLCQPVDYDTIKLLQKQTLKYFDDHNKLIDLLVESGREIDLNTLPNEPKEQLLIDIELGILSRGDFEHFNRKSKQIRYRKTVINKSVTNLVKPTSVKPNAHNYPNELSHSNRHIELTNGMNFSLIEKAEGFEFHKVVDGKSVKLFELPVEKMIRLYQG